MLGACFHGRIVFSAFNKHFVEMACRLYELSLKRIKIVIFSESIIFEFTSIACQQRHCIVHSLAVRNDVYPGRNATHLGSSSHGACCWNTERTCGSLVGEA